MKIILDECLPKKLKACFQNHEVSTVPEEGWAGKKNGELLKLIEKDFEAFITVDRNLSFQQNTLTTRILIVVIFCKSNRFQDLERLTPEIEAALAGPKRNAVIEVVDDSK